MKALRDLETAIKDSHAVGGSSVLLVPGVVNGKDTQALVAERSAEQIQKARPLAQRTRTSAS